MCVQNNEMLQREDCIIENDIDFGIFEPIRNEENNDNNIDDLAVGQRIQQRIIQHF